MGLANEKQFQNYHRVLNRAQWSSRALSRIVLLLLVSIFVPADAPIIVGLDETIERRRGAKIAAKGIYRDPVRSSKEYFVKTSGLRWVCMMLLVPIPWAKLVWALPFLSVLAPSERYYEQRKRRHKKITDWGRQMIRQLRRWLPNRYLVVVADSTYAVIERFSCALGMPQPVTVITRLRLDAALYDPAKDAQKGNQRTASPQRRPSADLGSPLGRSSNRVGDGDGVLLWWTEAHGGGSDGNCPVVSHRLAAGGVALGAHS